MSDLPERKQRLRLVIVGALLLGLAINWNGTAGIVQSVAGAFSPVIAGFVIALVLLAPMRFFNRLLLRVSRGKLGEKAREAISLILVILLVLLVIYISVTVLIPQVTQLLDTLVGILKNYQEILGRVREMIGIADVQWDAQWSEWIGKLFNRVAAEVQNLFISAITATSSLFTMLLSMTLAMYVLSARRQLHRALSKTADILLSKERAAFVKHTALLSVNTVSVWFSHQCLEGIIEGAALFVLMLIFGLPNPLAYAVITAITYLIPYVGAWIAFGIGFITMLSVDAHAAIVFGIILIVVQTIDGNVLSVHLVGGSVGLPPWLSLSAVCVFGALFGIGGMFLAVPTCAVDYVLVKDWLRAKEKQKKLGEIEGGEA
ncbi:MAG: AI-2E family transporter [Clostridia bacterium]|nr:AI-2E family transporter [Clostridia bacterium]